MGIFVRTTEPLPVGTVPHAAKLRAAAGARGLRLELWHACKWVNPRVRPRRKKPSNPGMGIRFSSLTPGRISSWIVKAIPTIAYLREEPKVMAEGGNWIPPARSPATAARRTSAAALRRRFARGRPLAWMGIRGRPQAPPRCAA